MNVVKCHFEKVSFGEYITSRTNGADVSPEQTEKYRKEWEAIKLPQRATSGSAGYDFFAPYDFTVDNVRLDNTISTGIRWVSDCDGLVLMLYPRSGLGFKHLMRLNNSTGIIDSDYSKSDNEGHIKARMTAVLHRDIKQGEAFMQGVIMPYFVCEDDGDFVKLTRNGGFGSTDNKIKN